MNQRLVFKLKTIYSANSFFRKIANSVTNTSVCLFIFRKIIEFRSQKDLNQGPINLIIENSSFCNAGCAFCPYKAMQRQKKIMNQATFNQVIKRIKQFNLPINKVFLSGMGEPLLDNNIVKRIKKLKSLGLNLKIYTNASVLTKKIAQKLIDFKVNELNISFNGFDKVSYEKIMRLDFNQTIKNINQLIKLKKQAGTDLPKIRVSMILEKENELGVKGYLQNWQNKVSSVTVSLAHEWGGGISPKTRNQFYKTQRVFPCRSLWHTIMIDSSGNFVICCRDYESKFVLGNVFNCSIAKIRGSKVIKLFKKQHFLFKNNELPKMCQQCNFPYQNGIDWLMPRSLD